MGATTRRPRTLSGGEVIIAVTADLSAPGKPTPYLIHFFIRIIGPRWLFRYPKYFVKSHYNKLAWLPRPVCYNESSL